MNPETTMTLEEAVSEVFVRLTGLTLDRDPNYDRWKTAVSHLNRALRENAMDHEWSCYVTTENVGKLQPGQRTIRLRSSVRPKMIDDDAVQLHDEHGHAVAWAYFLPRDSLHKYAHRRGLWASVVGRDVHLSRPLQGGELELDVVVPVIREPRQFRLPKKHVGHSAPIPQSILRQQVDFSNVDVIIARAAWTMAQFDPVMQPRVQTLEEQYKTNMYALVERDTRATDTPYQNEFFVPVQGGLTPSYGGFHGHPHADERY